MKILLCSPKTEGSKGGIAVWTDGYLAQLEKSPDISCDLVNTAVLGKRSENGNIKPILFDEFIRTKRIFADLKKRLTSDSYDVLHLNTSCGLFGVFRDCLLTKKARRISPKTKIVVHFHCNIRDWMQTDFSVKALIALARTADCNIVLNSDSRDYLRQVSAVEPTIIPNFISEDAVRRDKKPIAKNLKNILFVGYIQEAKGAKEIYSLASRFPDKEFHLVGDVEESIFQLEKSANLTLLGRKPHAEIPKLMEENDLFLFPSHSEGFSVALLEAMAEGMPIVATDVGANRDMIEPSGGIICPVGDVDRLAEAIRTADSFAFRSASSAANLDAVKNRYTSTAVFKQYLSAYQMITEVR